MSKLLLTLFSAAFFGIYCSSVFAKDAIEDANHFTVIIVAAIEYPFGEEGKGTGRGAGFLVDRSRGWIVTNAHVAGRSPSFLRLQFKDAQYVKAEKVYVDTHLDMAILKINPADIPSEAVEAPLQCGTEYPPGRPVIAFGHPWSLNYTATRGIISGTKVSGGVEVLQTDAALNDGNSGGPLIDAETGSVVGINTASRSSQTQGLHFAVPIKLVCTILDLLRQGKEPAPPLLPITFATTLQDKEVVVGSVGGDWSRVLHVGDRILAVNGDRSARNASRVLDQMRGKEQVSLVIERNSKEHVITLDVPASKSTLKRQGLYVSGMIVGPDFNLESSNDKIYIQFIDDSSMAQQAQLAERDQLIAINAIPINDYSVLENIIKDRDGQEVEFIVRRRRTQYGLDHYDLLVRKLELSNIFNITEKGIDR